MTCGIFVSDSPMFSVVSRTSQMGALRRKPVRAGIREILLPKDNEADLEDLPAEVRDRLQVSPVTNLAEALAVTLREPALRDGRLGLGELRRTDEPRLAH